MKKSLCLLLAAGSLWTHATFAAAPEEVRVAYSGGSQVLLLAKADGSLDKALNSKVKWVQFATGADALTYFAEAAISVNKLDRSKITLLPLRPAEMVAAWKRGDIDAGYVWAPFAQELESSGGHQVFATKDLQKDGYLIYNNYVVRKAFAQQYPEVVTAFLRVHQQKVDEFKPATAVSAKR
jgi:ABC-type taurine transport system substrate-binding protein